MSSQALLHSRRFVLNLRAAFLILVWLFIFAAGTPAQTPAPTPSHDTTPDLTREDRQLNEARRQNEEAQAEYYRTQTRKLNEPAPTKSFWRTLSDNAAILGALTAALVALFTLIVNQRTALRARKDTEFYEALKRFGDKDSPTVRASAAGILVEMSDTSFFAWRWRRKAPWWRPDQKMVRYPYFDTALDQLVTGLLIEEHTVVFHAIVAALERIMPRNIKSSSDRLREANSRLTWDMIPRLTDFFVAKGAKESQEVTEEMWNEAAKIIRFSKKGIKALAGHFMESFWIESRLAEEMTNLDQKQWRREISDKLIDVSRRLLYNVRLSQTLLSSRPETEIDPIDFSHTFLGDIDLSNANLRNINFRYALMPMARFYKSNLGGALFQQTDLEGAFLGEAELTDTKLYDAQCDSKPAFYGSNWWRADYRAVGGGGFDDDLVEKLIKNCGKLSPERVSEAHPSVRAYMAKRDLEPPTVSL